MEQSLAAKVADVIRDEAERQGIWSQAEISRLSGVPAPTIRRYFFTMEREPTIDVVASVAHALGMSTSELFRRVEADDTEAPDEEPARVVKAKRAAGRKVPTTVRQPRIVD